MLLGIVIILCTAALCWVIISESRQTRRTIVEFSSTMMTLYKATPQEIKIILEESNHHLEKMADDVRALASASGTTTLDPDTSIDPAIPQHPARPLPSVDGGIVESVG
jgi:hypothetical protein